MATVNLQTINLGGYANDGTGDDLRTAFSKVIANFELLKGAIPASLEEDTSPKLGGDLDLNGKNLFSNNNVTLTLPANKKFIINQSVQAPNFIGQISSINNHNLNDLGDVVIEGIPAAQTALVFDGTVWGPGVVDAKFATVDGGSAVSIYISDTEAVVDGGYA